MLLIVQAYGQPVSCIIGISNVFSSFSLSLHCVNSTNICQKKKKCNSLASKILNTHKNKTSFFLLCRVSFLKKLVLLNIPLSALLFIYFSLITRIVQSSLVKILSIDQDHHHHHHLENCQKCRISGQSYAYRIRICISFDPQMIYVLIKVEKH